MECIGNQISCPPSHLRRCPPSSSHACSLPSARPAMKGAPGRESFPGILRMWRRPGDARGGGGGDSGGGDGGGCCIFHHPLSFHLLAIHGNSTITATRCESCQRPSDGTSNWVDCLNGRAVCGDRDVECDWDIICEKFMSECVRSERG